jgi:hypothetical protein
MSVEGISLSTKLKNFKTTMNFHTAVATKIVIGNSQETGVTNSKEKDHFKSHGETGCLNGKNCIKANIWT